MQGPVHSTLGQASQIPSLPKTDRSRGSWPGVSGRVLAPREDLQLLAPERPTELAQCAGSGVPKAFLAHDHRISKEAVHQYLRYAKLGLAQPPPPSARPSDPGRSGRNLTEGCLSAFQAVAEAAFKKSFTARRVDEGAVEGFKPVLNFLGRQALLHVQLDVAFECVVPAGAVHPDRDGRC